VHCAGCYCGLTRSGRDFAVPNPLFEHAARERAAAQLIR